MMIRRAFSFVVLVLLFSSIPNSEGFSSSKVISSGRIQKVACHPGYQRNFERRPQWRCNDQGDVSLRVVIDPTTASSSVGGDDERSYDFISVEEAEEALQRERARYEGERSKLEWLLENQRKQLEDLENDRREIEINGDQTLANAGRSIASRRIVIRGAHAHVDINAMNSRKKRNKAKRENVREKINDTDETYIRMKRLESLLRDAIDENEKLTSQLLEQQHQYNAERNLYENEMREEQRILDSFRDELHMERAYFETSRRMLERMLEEEQHKVRELEQELFMLHTQGEVFGHQQPQCDQHEEQRRQQQAQQQRQKEQQRQKKRQRGGQYSGFTMNINDVQCPLYP
mmetsp:Transcript_28477/g.77113  ORF Transcript_28477/g.77113 Transcript_28477/m.77113 type:complete len:346 (+) Transcript_28477:199-1236(+)|eukprot:CAMPEP_0172367614 /NCGR_PEP_ID=MMETSP1060-20121228/22648_1 /TAXON_ID=37318 /ORGANISM="Pseudo-nitzschia pungens, Strain cf. cingulata" /LENGTH=345 /DNA_ID=CAMNT_0013091933 /DNA_START=139 /DNA_END=1176 /DNA_ORIENTATION=-